MPTAARPPPVQCGFTVLHSAARQGDIDFINTLLAKGADINATIDDVSPASRRSDALSPTLQPPCPHGFTVLLSAAYNKKTRQEMPTPNIKAPTS
jgi:ankyrin repeat protein